MNILTFDIEDWYCHDNESGDMDWGKHEVRIYEGVDRILDELAQRKQKATFFCLGWLAEHHPSVIRKIYDEGHQIGCHSYQHELATRFDRAGFRGDVERAKLAIEDAIGAKVELFRAPAFSITQQNTYALEMLCELGFTTDCSIFPAEREYGGMPEYGYDRPAIISCGGATIKEFPISPGRVAGRTIVYSGGGYFRLLPYPLIRHLTAQSEYVMTYFHPSDFDPGQPDMKHLPLLRRWKNRVGLKSAFGKFRHYLDDFEFVNVAEADSRIDWSAAKRIDLNR